jgi:DNA-binding HxlR family transcriptional regulator
MDINFLVKITSRAWSLTILALLDAGTPGRQAPLLTASGASRTAFAQSLQHLIALGLVERNPGHGNPLRPEFRLTPQGTTIAAVASKITSSNLSNEDSRLLRRNWTLPILAVSQSPRFFSEIKLDIGTITDRALSQSLQQLHSSQWLSRDIDPLMRPPRPRYSVTNRGKTISTALNF